jgi:hypothetical protein
VVYVSVKQILGYIYTVQYIKSKKHLKDRGHVAFIFSHPKNVTFGFDNQYDTRLLTCCISLFYQSDYSCNYLQ